MLALGMVIPVLPKLVESFLGGDTARASGSVRPVRDRLGADAVRVLAGPGRAVRSLRPPAGDPDLQFRPGLDYVLMALAPSLAWLFVGRVISGDHGGEHLDGVRLHRRRHAAGEARRALRHARRGVRHRLRARPGARRPARRHGSAAAVLGRGGLELCQHAVRPADPAGVAAARAARAVLLAARQSGRLARAAAVASRAVRARRASISSATSPMRCSRPSRFSTWRIAMASTSGRSA